MNSLPEKGKSYRCELCEQEFVSGWSEAEAMAEYKEGFGGGGDLPPAVLCDPCYQKVIAKFPAPLMKTG